MQIRADPELILFILQLACKQIIWKFVITTFDLIYMNVAQNLSGVLWVEKTIKGEKTITFLNKTVFVSCFFCV